MRRILLLFKVIRTIIWLSILFIIGGIKVMFDLSRRKSGTVLANIGRGEIILSVEFLARKAAVEFVTRHDHDNCHHHAPDWIKIDIIEARRRRSKVRISWYVKHQTLARYVVTG